MLVCFSSVEAGQTDRFEEGLLAEFRGEYERALTIWESAKNELEEADSRIGFEFIRLATEQEMHEYYQQASEMYYWALTAPLNGVNRAAIRQEIERLRPITGEGIYRQWVSLWEDQHPKLTGELRGFWVQLNPTPSYSYNERLIEHWERIAYSRRNFVKNRNTPYSTDDRALIYVRYGVPDHSKAGVFTIDNQNIGRWLSKQFELQQLENPDPEAEDKFYRDLEEERSFDQLENYIFQFHEYPEYEIWIYDSPTRHNQHHQPLIFIFGTEVETGKYYQQQSVDDFIPERAFLSDRRSLNFRSEFIREGLTPALILQMLYYEQLISVDSYFEQRLNFLRNAFIEQGPLAYASLDMAMRSQNREVLDMRVAEAPRQISKLDRVISRIPIQIYQYRLLDEENQPYMITFVESDPLTALRTDLEHNRNLFKASPDQTDEEADNTDRFDVKLVQSSYELKHSLQVYDEDWHLKSRVDHTPDLLSDHLTGKNILSSAFEISHDKQLFQSASVELLNTHPENQVRQESLFPNNLRGIGSLQYQQPVPLQADPESLEVGDLILGYRDDIPEDYPFSFRVANDQMISNDENLVLHFQVYNLEPREDTGFTHFELTYRIYPVSDVGKVLENQEEFYLTLNFESEFQRVIEDLEIQTGSLEEGLYELQVYVQDLENQQNRSRRIRFEVYDEERERE